MSNITKRDSAPRPGASVEDRLARLLESPLLAQVVPHLPAEALHQLIRMRGLDACSELVTAATPAQLTSLLDLDLWRGTRPGRDEQLDVERFGEWLEMLVDAGDAVAARTVAMLDTDLVVTSLSRYVRVFDAAIFEPTAQSDDEPTDRTGAMREGDSVHVDSGGDAWSMCADDTPHQDSRHLPECEVAGYLVRARREDAWDAIVALLLALDAGHGDYFQAVMQGCRRLSNSRPEIDGLDELLLAPEQHLHDVAVERERRRSQQGYATPADARAFLTMARQPHDTQSPAPASRPNPIVSAYFRAADEEPETPERSAPSQPKPGFDFRGGATSSPDSLTETRESIDAVLELLAEAGVLPERPRALLAAADADPRAARLAPLRRVMSYVRDKDESAYLARSRELAFLANTLVAGCSVQSRPFTPQEASDAAAAICNLGLEQWPARWPGTSRGDSAPDTQPPDSLLVERNLVTAFEVGWSMLHHEVCLLAAEQLIATLRDLDCSDRELRQGLVTLRRTLVRQREAGTPWRAREAAEVLATLDATAWIAVLGLLAECPVVPAALTAIVERRTTVVSPTEFEFIATTAQIGDVRRFLRRLPDLLSC